MSTIKGTNAADRLEGTAENDIIYAYAGDDFVSAKDGDDTVYGGNGNDSLYAGSGADVLFGDNGNDLLVGRKGNDTIQGGAGNDTIYGDNTPNDDYTGSGDDEIHGGDGNDWISAGDGDDTLYGGNGNDSLYAGSGADLLFGDSGNDSLVGRKGNDTIYGGAGNDTIYGDNTPNDGYTGSGDDEIHGGAGNDLIYGDDGDDTIFGDAGNDRIDGGSGADSIDGGAGNDTIYSEGSHASIMGGAGNDVLWVDGSNNSIDGGAGNDAVSVNGANNLIDGGAGSDAISVSGAGNLIYGGAGNNVIVAEGKDNTVVGGNGKDYIVAYYDGTTITTGGGKDYIELGLSSDGTANFTITDMTANDTFVILNDYDSVWKDDYTLRADLNSNNDIVLTANSGGKTLKITLNDVKDMAQIENVSVVSDGTLNLAKQTFTPKKNSTYKLGNLITGGTVPPAGVSLSGGTMVIGAKFKQSSIDLSAYSDLKATGIDASTVARKLALTGTDSADTIIGGKSNDTIAGGSGADSIDGGAGNDTISSEGSHASILGGAGNDVLWVDGSGNSIDGGVGSDYIGVTGTATIKTGAGNDTIMFNSSSVTVEDLDTKDTLVFIKGTDSSATWGKTVTALHADANTAAGTLTLTSSGTGDDDVSITLTNMTDTSKIDNLWVVLEGTTKDGKLQKATKRVRLSTLLNGGNIVSNSTLNGDTLTLTSKFAKTAFSLADYKTNGGTAANIDAQANARKIALTGSSDANTMYASKGGGTMTGGAGNDTLYGGKGNDVFSYATGDGDDVIYNYTAGKDSLKISDDVSSYTVSGQDVTLRVGSGSIALKDAAEKQITFLDNANKVARKVMYLVTGAAVETIGKAAKTVIDDAFSAGSFVQTDYTKAAANMDASSRTKSLNITGNAKANTIYAAQGGGSIDGGKGNDVIYAGNGGNTIIGGLGNDKLYGGAGIDIFSYSKGDGKDTIFNFESGKDKIVLTDLSIGDVKVTAAGDVILGAGSGNITLKNAKGKDIFITDATHSGGVTYNFTASCKQANLSTAAV